MKENNAVSIKNISNKRAFVLDPEKNEDFFSKESTSSKVMERWRKHHSECRIQNNETPNSEF